MHSFIVSCDTFSNDEKAAVVVPVTQNISAVGQNTHTCSKNVLCLMIIAVYLNCISETFGNTVQHFRLFVDKIYVQQCL